MLIGDEFGESKLNTQMIVRITYCKISPSKMFYNTSQNIWIDLGNTQNYLFLSNNICMIHIFLRQHIILSTQPPINPTRINHVSNRITVFVIISPTYQTIYIPYYGPRPPHLQTLTEVPYYGSSPPPHVHNPTKMPTQYYVLLMSEI